MNYPGSRTCRPHSGWVICHLALTSNPTVTPTGQPTPPPTASLEVVHGSSFCEIDSNGCVTDGAGVYGHSEACTIRVGVDGALTAPSFWIDTHNDWVTIGSNSHKYRGHNGPSNVAVAAGSTFTWRSRRCNWWGWCEGGRYRGQGWSAFPGQGWTICLNRSE